MLIYPERAFAAKSLELLGEYSLLLEASALDRSAVVVCVQSDAR